MTSLKTQKEDLSLLQIQQAMWCTSAEIYTDAQYILNVVDAIERGSLPSDIQQMDNPDLIRQLCHLWRQKVFCRSSD